MSAGYETYNKLHSDEEILLKGQNEKNDLDVEADLESDDEYADVRSSRVKYTDGSSSHNVMSEKKGNDFGESSYGKTTWRKHALRYLCFFLFGATFITVLYISIAAIYHAKVYADYSPNPYVTNYNPILGAPGEDPTGVIFATSKAAGLGTEENPIVVSLAGDSMMYNAFVDRDLNGKLQQRLSKKTDLKFKFCNHGHGGATIYRISQVIIPDIIADNASIVILNWDSDATDSHTYDMTPAEYAAFKESYILELDYVMGNVTSLPQVKFFAIAGPSIFGEGPLLAPRIITPDKVTVIAELREINIEMAQKHKVPYIDMNHALHSVSVSWWGLYKMWCTVDGEHYGELGASIEADNFVRFLTY